MASAVEGAAARVVENGTQLVHDGIARQVELTWGYLSSLSWTQVAVALLVIAVVYDQCTACRPAQHRPATLIVAQSRISLAKAP